MDGSPAERHSSPIEGDPSKWVQPTSHRWQPLGPHPPSFLFPIQGLLQVTKMCGWWTVFSLEITRFQGLSPGKIRLWHVFWKYCMESSFRTSTLRAEKIPDGNECHSGKDKNSRSCLIGEKHGDQTPQGNSLNCAEYVLRSKGPLCHEG